MTELLLEQRHRYATLSQRGSAVEGVPKGNWE